MAHGSHGNKLLTIQVVEVLPGDITGRTTTFSVYARPGIIGIESLRASGYDSVVEWLQRPDAPLGNPAVEIVVHH